MDLTLLKGLRLLEHLARSDQSRGVSDLARELELTKSNVHRTLQTLVDAGYVRKCAGSGHYECTLKLFELGSAILARTDIRQVAEGPMAELARITEETIHLSALQGRDVVYVHKIESPQPVRAYSSIGGRAPAYCVASGKALLAFTPGALEQFADPLPTYSPKSIGTVAALAKELEDIRRSGVAVNWGEWREAVRGVAAPIFDATGATVGSIGISGPAERLTEAAIEKFSPNVITAAAEISAALGHRGGSTWANAS